MADNIDWIHELSDDDLRTIMDRDNKLVYENCDLRTLLDLMQNLHSIQLYISQRPLERAQQLYIVRNFAGDNHKELAAKLGCSLKYVYQTLKEVKESTAAATEADLFEN